MAEQAIANTTRGAGVVMEWTPGPWTVEDDSGTAFDAWWVAGPSWVFDGNNNVGIENEADARLIALAPEMAELLRSLIDPAQTTLNDRDLWSECTLCAANAYASNKPQAHAETCPFTRASALLARARSES